MSDRTLYVKAPRKPAGEEATLMWVVPATVDDLPPEAIKRAARAWAETIVGGAEVDQLAGDPLATEQALKVLRAALGETDEVHTSTCEEGPGHEGSCR